MDPATVQHRVHRPGQAGLAAFMMTLQSYLIRVGPLTAIYIGSSGVCLERHERTTAMWSVRVLIVHDPEIAARIANR